MRIFSPLWFVLLPLAASFVIILLGRFFKQFSGRLCLLVSACLFAMALKSIFFISSVSPHVAVFRAGKWMPPFGIALVLDSLSALLLVVVSLVVVLVTLYSLAYMQRYTHRWKFYSLFLFLVSGLNGILISGDLFNLYIFLEVASLAGYALVAFGTEAPDLEAAFKYAIMGSVASVFILLGIAMLYSFTSTLNMADMAQALAARPNSILVTFVTVLFIAGFGLKAAIVPFHAWLADAHPSAPAPISAILSGVFIKTAGIYALIRVIFNIFGVSAKVPGVFIFLGVLSMCVGAFLAMTQKDIKRMFAYSSISQVGYIIFALGIGTPLAVFAALFHLVNHAISKALLFLNAGAIEYSTGTRDLSKLGGLNKSLPVTGFTSLIGALSISGIPPLGGFWSKLLIILAAVEARCFGTALIAALVSIITLAYYFKFQSFAFFGKPAFEAGQVKEAPRMMLVSMVILAAVVLLSGILFMPGAKYILKNAADIILAGPDYQLLVQGAMR